MKISKASNYDEQVARAIESLEQEEYDTAREQAEEVVQALEPHLQALAIASRISAKAGLMSAFQQQQRSQQNATTTVLSQAWEGFRLSQQLDPSCEQSKAELKNLTRVYRQMAGLSSSQGIADFDVVIVGAGAAGIGTALTLTETFGLHKERVLLVERGATVGSSFLKWPKEMRFISPSFNQQGWTPSFDLNSIRYGTSPAFSMHSEHPTGREYAAYLKALVDNHRLQLVTHTEVVSVEPDDYDDDQLDPMFFVKTRKDGAKEQLIIARYVVWAGGEYQYPRGGQNATAEATIQTMKLQEEKKSEEDLSPTSKKQKTKTDPKDFCGSEHCLHNSNVGSWENLKGDDFVVIGGYESGIDACYHLANAGKKTTVLASTRCWRVKTADPSSELAPFTSGRLCQVMHPGFAPSPRLLAPIKVTSVEKKTAAGGSAAAAKYIVTAEWKVETPEAKAPLRSAMNTIDTEVPGAPGTKLVLETTHPPILCTGFKNSVVARAGNLFDFVTRDGPHARKGCLDGAPLLTKRDESTKVPGIFLVGPMVSHGSHSFCFVYKFRQRFAIVAQAICEGLGLDTRAAVAECRQQHMYLDDLSCCENACGDVC